MGRSGNLHDDRVPGRYFAEVWPTPLACAARGCEARRRNVGSRFVPTHSDLSEAMSIEKRYFTSDLSSLS